MEWFTASRVYVVLRRSVSISEMTHVADLSEPSQISCEFALWQTVFKALGFVGIVVLH